MDEETRQRIARKELAVMLSDALRLALSTGLLSEAALIAKLIEGTINHTTTALILKLK